MINRFAELEEQGEIDERTQRRDLYQHAVFPSVERMLAGLYAYEHPAQDCEGAAKDGL